MKKVLLFLTLFILMPTVYAKDITGDSEVFVNDKNASIKIKDGKEKTYKKISKNDIIKIKSKGIKGLYIIYHMKSSKGMINIGNEEIEIGENGFLHEYVDLKKYDIEELSIRYKKDVTIADIYVLDGGDLPDFVEVWNPPLKEADLLLFSTHADDEQLFFLGLLPTYVARGADVEVVYFVKHDDKPERIHEQLHGLYAVGIRAYPILGIVKDAFSRNLNTAIYNMNKSGMTEDDALKFEVEQIRRFKPQVIVGHDEAGEYSHGQHILNTYILKKALLKANDKNYDKDTINKYGLWDTPKTYLHLYKKNKIVMDYDKPLKYFGGKTAYEVSKIGFSKHISQQKTNFNRWMFGKDKSYKKATEIKMYSPLNYGLYRTTVGEDIKKNDLFENLKFRKNTENKTTTTKKTTTNNSTKSKPVEIQKENKLDSKFIIAVFVSISCIIGLVILNKKK